MRLDKGAMSMALLLLLAYLMVGSGQERSIRSAGPAAFPSNLVSSEFCHDRDFVFYLQREMWMMAREETFESQQTKFVDEKLELYELSFGAVEVAISEAKKPAAKPKPQPTPQRNRGRGSVAMPGATGSNEGRSVSEPLHSMTYYRIFKNANDNIRSIMAELAYAISDENKAFRALNCYKSECIHHLLHERSPHALKNMYISPNRAKRFSFTFVRDPIDRFIAGMTEIEYRYQQATANAPSSDALSLQQPLGSTLRVEEFIRMILDSDGSYAWLKRQPQVEMMHIVPMIGTLLLGEHVEGRPLNLYKFEDFDSEWERLSKESGLPILLGLYRNRSSQQWARHPSSSDPYSTTSAAREFFSFASPDALMRYFSPRRITILSPSLLCTVFLFLFRSFLCLRARAL